MSDMPLQTKSTLKIKAFIIFSVIPIAITVIILTALFILPNWRYNQAIESFKTGKYERAYATLGKLPAEYKDVSSLLPYYKAYALYENKDFEGAARAFDALQGYGNSEEMVQESRYKQGELLLNEKRFEEAHTLFTTLGEYADSKNMVLESKYLQALNFLQTKLYSDAYAIFQSMSEYKDSKTMLLECRYLKAKDLLEEALFDEARERLLDLGEYKDSGQMLRECDYLEALSLLDDKRYEEAFAIFKRIEDYKDSGDMLIECRYLKGRDLFQKNDFAGALERFEFLGDYKNSLALFEESAYRESIRFISAKNYKSAEALLQKIPNYRDSSQLMENIKVKWKEAYKEFLTNILNNGSIYYLQDKSEVNVGHGVGIRDGVEVRSFELEDLNNDGTPELLLEYDYFQDYDYATFSTPIAGEAIFVYDAYKIKELPEKFNVSYRYSARLGKCDFNGEIIYASYHTGRYETDEALYRLSITSDYKIETVGLIYKLEYEPLNKYNYYIGDGKGFEQKVTPDIYEKERSKIRDINFYRFDLTKEGINTAFK